MTHPHGRPKQRAGSSTTLRGSRTDLAQQKATPQGGLQVVEERASTRRDPASLPFSSTGTAPVFSRRNAVTNEKVPCLWRSDASSEESGTAATLVLRAVPSRGMEVAEARGDEARCAHPHEGH